jgi:hypothetical protein
LNAKRKPEPQERKKGKKGKKGKKKERRKKEGKKERRKERKKRRKGERGERRIDSKAAYSTRTHIVASRKTHSTHLPLCDGGCK